MNLDELADDFFDDPPARELDMPGTHAAQMDEDEANVAEVFGDFDSDMAEMESAMVDSLKIARGSSKKSKKESQEYDQVDFCRGLWQDYH